MTDSLTQAQKIIASAMTHAELDENVDNAAARLGYDFRYHTHSSRFSYPGFPDWFLLSTSRKRVITIENKVGRDKLRPGKCDKKGNWLPGQAEWLEALSSCGIPSYEVRPEDWESGEVIRILKGV